ncbi:hypothetical protein KJZ99_05470 [bacterium]|nr:hypothetical protein [bacterium]
MRAYYQRLFHFDHWANVEVEKSLKSCAVPPPKAVALLSHYLQEQWVAHKLLTTGVATNRNEIATLTFEECQAEIQRLNIAWREYLANKPDLHFDTSFTYTNAVGKPTDRVVGDLLTDIVDHGTYHRGQIATLVRQAGGEPAKTWFTRWVKETKRGTTV